MSNQVRHPAIVFALVTVLLDLVFKFIAVKRLPSNGSLSVEGFVEFGLHKNPGIAFDIPVPHLLLFALTATLLTLLGLLAYNNRYEANRITTGSVITIIGALGNFIDRLVNGFTTDYILFANGSAINLADIIIIVGILTILFNKKENKNTDIPTALG